MRTRAHKAWQTPAESIHTICPTSKKLKWENISPVSQHIPQYSTSGSRSILLDLDPRVREKSFLLWESQGYVEEKVELKYQT